MNSTAFEFPTSPDDLLYPAVFHNGKAYFLERSNRFLTSYFGGPPPSVPIGGVKHGPYKLHHILTVGGDCLSPLFSTPAGQTLYLMYGMRFDGCQLTYKSRVARGIEILEMTPTESSPDWPYPDYPDLLPYLPMRLQACVDCTLEEFAQISCQPLEADPAEALVIVPPSPVLGVSLWGPAGDAELVQIVFRCNMTLAQREDQPRRMEALAIVRADTQCA